MKEKDKTFGRLIHKARKKKGLTLKDCASLILKDDGIPISIQYLRDIELNLRHPPAKYLIDQLSQVLEIQSELLYFYAKIFPSNINPNLSEEAIAKAYCNFAKALS